MLVFTDEWVQKIRRRYKQYPDYQKPWLYTVAISNKLETVRNEIEEWVNWLPQSDQSKVIKNLQSKNFIQTYHELAVGSILKRLGYQVEYEKKIDNNLTPDWYAHPNKGRHAFIVEIFTDNRSETTEKHDKQENDLLGRLQQISIDVALNINFDLAKVALDQQKNKIISKKVQQWLTNNDPPIGAQLDSSGIVFEIFDRDRNYPNLQYVSSTDAFWIDTESLRKNIETKINKYKVLAKEKGIPIVVGIVVDPKTGLSLKSLQDVLLGEREVIVTFEKTPGSVVKQEQKRRQNGLFKINEALSAAIWMWKDDFGKWRIKTIYNPFAKNPLPTNTFGEECFFEQ